MKIEDLQNDKYTLITDSQEVKALGDSQGMQLRQRSRRG